MGGCVRAGSRPTSLGWHRRSGCRPRAGPARSSPGAGGRARLPTAPRSPSAHRRSGAGRSRVCFPRLSARRPPPARGRSPLRRKAPPMASVVAALVRGARAAARCPWLRRPAPASPAQRSRSRRRWSPSRPRPRPSRPRHHRDDRAGLAFPGRASSSSMSSWSRPSTVLPPSAAAIAASSAASFGSTGQRSSSRSPWSCVAVGVAGGVVGRGGSGRGRGGTGRTVLLEEAVRVELFSVSPFVVGAGELLDAADETGGVVGDADDADDGAPAPAARCLRRGGRRRRRGRRRARRRGRVHQGGKRGVGRAARRRWARGRETRRWARRWRRSGRRNGRHEADLKSRTDGAHLAIAGPPGRREKAYCRQWLEKSDGGLRRPCGQALPDPPARTAGRPPAVPGHCVGAAASYSKDDQNPSISGRRRPAAARMVIRPRRPFGPTVIRGVCGLPGR